MTTIRKALQRLSDVESSVADLTQRVDALSTLLGGTNQRLAAQREEIAREKLDRLGLDQTLKSLDGELRGTQTQVRSLNSHMSERVNSLGERIAELRAELYEAAYIELTPAPLSIYINNPVREAVSTVLRRVADAAHVELTAHAPKRGEIRARAIRPDIGLIGHIEKGGLWGKR